MGRTASCPDCQEPVSIISAMTVIRDGAVVLICPACLSKPAPTAEPTGIETTTAAPAAVDLGEPETVSVTVSEPVTVSASATASASGPGPASATGPEPAPEPAPEPPPTFELAPALATAVDVADITGEIALQTADDEPVPTKSRWKYSARIIAAAALSVVAITGFRATQSSSTPLTLSVAFDTAEPPISRMVVEPTQAPLYHALSVSLTEEQSALPWVHPIAGVRQLPDKEDRRFGAPRPGMRPGECLAGHCGVDLGGGRGAIVHAVLGGKLIRVKREAGGASGRFVAIEHPQGVRSTYMHLDRVHPNLVEGVEIASGEPIGTLGSTGVRNSPPHLHFTVQKLSEGSGWQYVDPEPMLEQATLLAEAAPMPDPPIVSPSITGASILKPSRRAPARRAKPTPRDVDIIGGRTTLPPNPPVDIDIDIPVASGVDGVDESGNDDGTREEDEYETSSDDLEAEVDENAREAAEAEPTPTEPPLADTIDEVKETDGE